ncbi:hypothetical protein TruAng_000164 [Truncatella angustata]|nr:hypothetical protein TruAng_000164 [Truncatella angustata]
MSNEKVVDVEAGWTVRPHDGRHHSHISQVVQRLDTEDADEAYGGAATHHATNINDNPAQIIISWAADDKDNPYNWPKSKKLPFVLSTMILVVNSTMGSSLPSMAIPYMMAEWGIADQEQKVLPISTYLIGYVCGPIIFASSPIAIVAGQLADTFDDPVTRGRAFAWFMAMTVFGPLLAPIISGFCSTTIGWRWSFWIGLIYAGFSLLVVLIIVPETYGPKLLAIRARKMRKETGNPNIFAASELESRDLSTVVSRVLTRPLRMLYSELIVTSTSFPIIFQQLYGLAPGVTGLCFLSIGIGALLALPVFYAYDGYLRRAQNQKKAWSRQEEYRRVPLACIGGPLFVISLLWLGWSARTNTTFVVPMLAGIPFGLGFQLIFMALLNYLTDAYEIYAASANAAASATRSLVAVVLPFATTPMFQRLGIGGACSVLAGLSLFMCFIPFIFLWKGEQIRERSKFCIMLKQEKEAHAREADGGQRSSQLGHVPEHT